MVRRWFFAIAVVLVAGIAALGVAWRPTALWAFALVGPLVLLGVRDAFQDKHSLLRDYPSPRSPSHR